MTRYAIAEIERQLEETKRTYLRSHGWDMTFDAPGTGPMWARDFTKETDAESEWRFVESLVSPHGVIVADINLAVQMTMLVLDPEDPIDADLSE